MNINKENLVKVLGGEIHHFPITPGEVFRRDRLTKDEGEKKCVGPWTSPPGPGASGGGDNPGTCNENSFPPSVTQEFVGGNFDYNWNR